jgi:hypothetical protein
MGASVRGTILNDAVSNGDASLHPPGLAVRNNSTKRVFTGFRAI